MCLDSFKVVVYHGLLYVSYTLGDRCDSKSQPNFLRVALGRGVRWGMDSARTWLTAKWTDTVYPVVLALGVRGRHVGVYCTRVWSSPCACGRGRVAESGVGGLTGVVGVTGVECVWPVDHGGPDCVVGMWLIWPITYDCQIWSHRTETCSELTWDRLVIWALSLNLGVT